MTIQVRPLTREDYSSMTDLFNRARNKNTPDSEFKKKYHQPYFDGKFIGTGAFSGDKLIGMCPITFYHFEGDNRKFILGQLGDLVMDKEYQGNGIFSELLNSLVIEAKKNELDGLFVFPNENAAPIFEKNEKWRLIGNFVRFDFDLKTYPLLKTLNRFGMQNNFYRFSKKDVSVKFSDENIKTINVPLNEEYFNYKSYRPFRIFNTSVSSVIWSLSDGIIINRSTVDDIDSLQKEIRDLTSYFAKRGGHKLTYIVKSGSRIHFLLSKICRGRNSNPIYIHCMNDQIKIDALSITGFERNYF